MWPDVENPPGPCIMTTELTHRAPQIQIGDDNLTVTNDKGYRMAKASHGVVEGAWYYEGTLVNSQGAVRMGWSQISGDLQGPCGLDHYSYSFRSDPPTRFHRSIGHSYGSKFQVGDTLGVLIYLPPPTDEQFEDLLNRRFILGRDRRYVSFNYTSTRDPHDPMDSDPASPEEVLPEVPDSAIAYYLNGRPLGTAFTNLYLGKYYPTVSCYMGAQIRLNFGPDFKYPPPAHWRGVPVESLQMCPPENYLQESQPAEH
ncbi:concanavalin A-like lectin/glucanase domain-containing protein [Dimargaris cristalligena]|uniref:Concanavalin A-like lectin/glucanase domain-containing protein n=1 Tax=Dimargaris cristalligena TaxID=215637 RepID=A0A4P9ZSE3_9FUNG|nr:concanavalin A-like lectin/glucanase domain-containing protein [Dimargaris cristalligena]|eukprot:RKP36393.1 concanavalin A-like lectin/glucanase domain-containing protein [Dimargaris cristalligena]